LIVKTIATYVLPNPPDCRNDHAAIAFRQKMTVCIWYYFSLWEAICECSKDKSTRNYSFHHYHHRTNRALQNRHWNSLLTF